MGYLYLIILLFWEFFTPALPNEFPNISIYYR